MMRQYELVERVKRYNPLGGRGAAQPRLCLRDDGPRQRRSGPRAISFFGHPLEVAAILTDLKLDDATIVAAVLHDTIEDTEATLRGDQQDCSGRRSAPSSTG